MSALSPGSVLCRAALLASSLMVTLPVAYAQIIEGHIYYYTDTATVNTNISGNDVVLGKAPGGVFANAAGDTDITTPYTLTIPNPGKITSNGSTGYAGLEAFNHSMVAVTGGSVSSLRAHNHASVTVSGGSVSSITAYDNASMTLGGTVTGVTCYNNSTVNVITSGVGGITAHDTATVNVSLFGNVANTYSYGASTVNFATGTNNNAYSYDNSVVNIKGGTLVNVVTNHSSKVNISGGTVNAFVVSHDSSMGTITGGTVGFITPEDASTFNVSGGTVTEMDCLNNSQANISGGSIQFLTASSNSQVNISGGTFQEVFGLGSSVFNLSGGMISASTIYQLNDNATFHFFGQSIDFSNPTAGIYQTKTKTYTGVYYDVMWTQATGTMDNTRFFDANGNVGDGFPQGVFFQSSLSPEPDALQFLALASLAVMGWRHRDKVRSGL